MHIDNKIKSLKAHLVFSMEAQIKSHMEAIANDDAFIVMLNESGKYFHVKYYGTTITEVKMVEKEMATRFRKFGTINIARCDDFSFFLHCKGVTSADITIEKVANIFRNSKTTKEN